MHRLSTDLGTGLGTRVLVAWYGLRDRLEDTWRSRDERGLSTVEMAVAAVGLVIAAGIFVTVIVAVVRSQTNDLKNHT